MPEADVYRSQVFFCAVYILNMPIHRENIKPVENFSTFFRTYSSYSFFNV